VLLMITLAASMRGGAGWNQLCRAMMAGKPAGLHLLHSNTDAIAV
jgi:hypothetical protein